MGGRGVGGVEVGGWEIKWVPGGDPHKNPRSLSSPKAEKQNIQDFVDGLSWISHNGQSDLYYPLVADKNCKTTSITT